jgi:hypothetical protein
MPSSQNHHKLAPGKPGSVLGLSVTHTAPPVSQRGQLNAVVVEGKRVHARMAMAIVVVVKRISDASLKDIWYEATLQGAVREGQKRDYV